MPRLQVTATHLNPPSAVLDQRLYSPFYPAIVSLTMLFEGESANRSMIHRDYATRFGRVLFLQIFLFYLN
jgi:hypothetical protein